MIGVDTDVLAIRHIFKRDERYTVTARFLEQAEDSGCGVPIFSLLELCGLIATASKSTEAIKVFEMYLASASTLLLYPHVELLSAHQFWARQNAALLERIQRGLRLGDAAILWTVEATGCDTLVTWSTRHYLGKTSVLGQTPESWLTEATGDGL